MSINLDGLIWVVVFMLLAAVGVGFLIGYLI